MIEVRDLPKPAIGDGGGKRRDDQSATEARRQLDRRLGERAYVGRNRALQRLRRDSHIAKVVILAMVRNSSVSHPQGPHEFEPLFEDALVVLKTHMERRIFAAIVAPSN